MNLSANTALLHATYARSRALVAKDAPCVVLHLGASVSAWAWGLGAEADETAALAIGIETLVQARFPTARPSESAVEWAIAEVEEIVMPWHRRLPRQGVLVSGDAYVSGLARVAGVSTQDDGMLSTDAVEALFNQWADETLGGASRARSLPTTGTFAATLLVVREVLHHLGFTGIRVLRALPG